MSHKKFQISKKVGWIIMILVILVAADSYYLYSLYQTELEKSEVTVLNELKVIAKSAAMQINGDDHENLTKNYVNKDDINEENHEKTQLYRSVRETLIRIKEVNKLKTNVYTIFRNKKEVDIQGRKTFVFAVSAASPFYRHKYTEAPEELFNNYLIGGEVSAHKTEKGYLLSAFEPIYNRNRQVVAVVQVDRVFTSFVSAARRSIIGNIIFSIVIFSLLIIAIISVNRQSKKLKAHIRSQKDNFIKLTAYAEKIGQGEYDAEYQLNGENDNLGNSLVKMSQNLKSNKEKDLAENWLAIGRDKVSTILRENTNTQELSYNVLVELINYIGSVQGAMFTVNKTDGEVRLEMIASYAYGRKKYTVKSFKLGEGLIGEAAIEQQTIHRTEIPDDHLTITSGLIKDKKPSALLMVPLVTEEKLQGVIELAGFNRFTDIQIRLIEELAEILARTLFNLKTAERTKELLIESQTMTQELQVQQEQLEENAKEMQMKQDEIESSNAKLEEQINEVENAQKRLYALLVDSSELIAIYSEDGTIVYDSPSIVNILGHTPEEMQGVNIFTVTDNPSPALLKIREVFNFLIENPDKTTSFQSVYTRKDGVEIVLKGVAKNSISDPSVNGIVINFRDITEQLLADQEINNAQKRQHALLENSSEVISVYTKEGTITYESPAITRILGYTQEEMIGVDIFESKNPSESLKKIRELHTYLSENPDKAKKIQLAYTKKDGTNIMLEALGKNSFNEPAVNGIIINFRDITEQLIADEEIKNAQKRQHALLENSSELITIYSEEGIVTYNSPSIKRILGYKQEETIGSSLFSEDLSVGQLKIREAFNYLIKNPKETTKFVAQYNKSDGTSIYLEALGRNLFHEPAVNGIVMNFRDITERRLAEKEQIMRGKMQSLSENSEDIIIRFDLEGIFQYANPTLERITGVNTTGIIGTSFYEQPFNEELKEIWKNVIENVGQDQKLVVKEASLKVMGNEKMMLINAIPEFDDNKKLETILLVAHDITERKKQEVVLASTNKKITESINYAKRIQNAIIPSIEEIKKDIPETFMFYKPKDVVSGDFPYYYKKGDYLYYAAVDCTGHGVPGAMMSLIGHLLLNDILNDEAILNPAEVLTQLHWRVVRTLKQDDKNNKAADGMDIAMCRINLKNNEIEYSGAHRPLYHVRNGELTQYKGDKYPIGGDQYKGKNSYTNHNIMIEKGDAVFFFSDGLPDQFGGPNKLKYGPKQIREGIVENVSKSTDEIQNYFEKSYHDWMGSTKQIDDVLLIGIKF